MSKRVYFSSGEILEAKQCQIRKILKYEREQGFLDGVKYCFTLEYAKKHFDFYKDCK